MFEITLEEMLGSIIDDLELVAGAEKVLFVDKTDRVPAKPFNEDIKQPIKRKNKKSNENQEHAPVEEQHVDEKGAASDVKQHTDKPKHQKKTEEKQEQAPVEEQHVDEKDAASDIKQPDTPEPQKKAEEKQEQPPVEEQVNGNSGYTDEKGAASDVKRHTDNPIPQQTLNSPTQVHASEFIDKFVTPHHAPEMVKPKNIYGDALKNGAEYSQQIQQQAMNAQAPKIGMLDVNAINSHIASLPMESKDEFIRACCAKQQYPSIKGIETPASEKIKYLKTIVDFLPNEQVGRRSVYSINLQAFIIALTSKYIKNILTKNGIDPNAKFREVASDNPNYDFAFVAENDKVMLKISVNSVPKLVQFTDANGCVGYSWNIDKIIENIAK